MAKLSPTQRSKAFLEKLGGRVAIVERWNHHIQIRQDLFGFADLLVVREGRPPMLVQVTAAGVSTRLNKMLTERREIVRECLLGGFQIEVHGWSTLRSKAKNLDGKRSKKPEVRMRIIPVTLDMVSEATEATS